MDGAPIGVRPVAGGWRVGCPLALTADVCFRRPGGGQGSSAGEMSGQTSERC